MPDYDLNLLVALDMLLTEGSVSKTARRLGLSDSAMSRTLSRIRETFDDPILVRAGRSLVPTPRAITLKESIRALLDEADRLVRTSAPLDLTTLARRFVLRMNEGFIIEFGGRLLRLVAKAAPGVSLHFAVKAEKDATALREGRVDLDIGVLGASGPEIKLQTLFRDRFVGVTAPDHHLATGTVTIERYCAAPHISVSRRGMAQGPIDDALRAHGMSRDVVAVVPSFPAALAMVQHSPFVANVPERQTAALRQGLFRFALPVVTEEVIISMMWHPRSDADPAHRWLRACVREVCET